MYDNIAAFSGNLEFHSPLEFQNLNVHSIRTEDIISGIRFDNWFDLSLSLIKDSHIHANWFIENLYLKSDIEGNGKVNFQDVTDVIEKMDNQVQNNNIELVGISNEYNSICNEIKSLADRSNEGINYFKYFELNFMIEEKSQIYSAFSFKTHQYQKILVNIGCESSIYRWDVSLARFVKTSTIKTGFVKQAVSVDIGIEESHLVILSDHQKHDCLYKGLTVHKNINGIFTTYRTLEKSQEIFSIHSMSENATTFYALCDTNKIIEYDVNLNQLEEWQLPPTNGKYRFLSNGILNGISLSDGKNLISISSIRRVKRNLIHNLTDFDTTPMENEKLATKMAKLSQQTNLLKHLLKPEAERTAVDTISLESNSSRSDITPDDDSNPDNKHPVYPEIFNYQENAYEPVAKQNYLHDSQNVVGTQSANHVARTRSDTNEKSVDTSSILNEIENQIQNLYEKITDSKIDDNGVADEGFKQLVNEEKITLGETSEKTRKIEETIHSNDTLRDLIDRWENLANELKDQMNTTEKEHENKAIDNEFSEKNTNKDLKNDTESLELIGKIQKIDEDQIASEIPVSGVHIAANNFLPGKKNGEVVLLNVGIHDEQRKLIAVLVESDRKSTIPGQYDTIKIYENIHEGKLFQTIPCYQPSGLSVIHLRDETILSFLEAKAGVRVYVYRGIQGFVLMTSFNLNKLASDMKSLEAPLTMDTYKKCNIQFLSIISGKEILFFEAHTEPNRVCGIHANLKCDD